MGLGGAVDGDAQFVIKELRRKRKEVAARAARKREMMQSVSMCLGLLPRVAETPPPKRADRSI